MMRDSGAHYLHPAPQPVQPVWTGEVRPSRAGPIVLAVAGILLGGIALLVVFVYLATFLGTGELLVSLALALVPLAAVLFAVRWIDRWDPEPRPALWFAFLWGAGVSIVTALLFDLGVQLAVLAASGGAGGGDSPGNAFLSAVVQAPIVEEAAKGVGILLLFWGLRKHFDGPVDGVVFAATIAAGFAFSENIQYFGLALAEGGLGALGLTFVVRGLFSPFAHVMFTACTGFALGIAAGRVGPLGAVGYYLAGLVPATLLHALWNGAFTLFAADSSLIAYYLLVQVPLFLGAIVVVVLIRRHEVRVTVRRLGEYVAAGTSRPRKSPCSPLRQAGGRRGPGRQPRRRRSGRDASLHNGCHPARVCAEPSDQRLSEPGEPRRRVRAARASARRPRCCTRLIMPARIRSCSSRAVSSVTCGGATLSSGHGSAQGTPTRIRRTQGELVARWCDTVYNSPRVNEFIC